MSGLIESPARIWLAVAPVDMRRGLDGLSAIVQQSLGAFAVCRIGLYLSQPSWQPLTAVAVGWQRRLVMPAPTASGPFCLAQDIGRLFRDKSGTMAMVDRRGELATIIDGASHGLASLIPALSGPQNQSVNRVKAQY